MKKHLLTLILFLTVVAAKAQTFQPSDLSACTPGDDLAYVDLSDATDNMWGTSSPSDYIVTYHNSLSDADADINPIPDFQEFAIEFTTEIVIRVENLATGTWQSVSFTVTVTMGPSVDFIIPEYACDTDSDPDDGYTTIDLNAIAQDIVFLSGSTPSELIVSFHHTPEDAEAGINDIPYTGYINAEPGTGEIYIRSEFASSGCFAISVLMIFVEACESNCDAPSDFDLSNATYTGATAYFSSTAPSVELYITLQTSPDPTFATTGIPAVSPYVITGLICGTEYKVFARSICAGGEPSVWSVPYYLQTLGCPQSGTAENLSMCSDSAQACFDLGSNDSNIINTLDPSLYNITYHTSNEAASQDIGAIGNPANYCLPVPVSDVAIFARLENIADNTSEIFQFLLNAQQTVPGSYNLGPVVKCDEDSNGSVEFNLTLAVQYLPVSNLAFYENSSDANSGVNAIPDPQHYMVAANETITTIFVRETVANECDPVYVMTLNATAVCNPSSFCSGAISLCNAFGVPFPNTQNMAADVALVCGEFLEQPNNLTWFSLSIATAGDLTLRIQQDTSANFNGTGLNVDFAAYGPFTDAVTPCSGLLTDANLVDCGYSPGYYENVTIPSAQPGQFYLLMVSNYTNEPGYIRIIQTADGPSEISCTGLRLNAFIDSNGNGLKESDESNFELGTYTYKSNDDNIVHNIIADSDVYDILDISNTATYDLGFTIDPAYAANYSLATPLYSDVTVGAGSGMHEYLFPVTVTNAYTDLSVSIVGTHWPIPNSSYTNNIIYRNLGSQAISGTLSFVKDPLVTIQQNTQSGVVNTATGFSYNFTNLLPFEVRQIIVTMYVPSIPFVALGDLLTNTATITPLNGDVAAENNASESTQTIVDIDYDTNYQTESRGPQILITDFTPDDYLYYTIRFEKPGSAPTTKLAIADALHPALDAASMRMVAASHSYVLNRMGNQLNWNLEDIQGGTGYVQFKVKPLPGYEVGDVIANTASINFDYVPAIVTNTFTSTFVGQLGIDNNSLAHFNVYPNPAKEQVFIDGDTNIEKVTIFDLLGKTIKSKLINGTSATVDVSEISSGLYLVEISNGSSRSISKLVIE